MGTRVENEVSINVLCYTTSWKGAGTNLMLASDFHGTSSEEEPMVPIFRCTCTAGAGVYPYF